MNNSNTNIFDMNINDVIYHISHARIAATTKQDLWEGITGQAAKTSHKYWSKIASAQFTEACYKLARTGNQDVFADDLRGMQRLYDEFIPKQRVIFTCLEKEWTESSFITLLHKYGDNAHNASTYQSYTKDELLEYLRSDHFDPKVFGMWKESTYKVNAFRTALRSTEMGDRCWSQTFNFANTKRRTLMDSDSSQSNVACYFLAQSIYKEATKSIAFWKPIFEWNMDKAIKQVEQMEGSTELYNNALRDLREVEGKWSEMQTTAEDIRERCERFAGHMHKVIKPAFAHAYEKLENGDYRPIYNEDEAIALYIKRAQEQQLANKDEDDAIVLELIRQTAELPVFA